MNKHYLFILLIFFSAPLNGQVFGEVRFGVSGSQINMPKEFDEEVDAVWNIMYGASVGTYLGTKLSGQVWIQSEAFGVDVKETDLHAAASFRLRYLQIQPEISYKLTERISLQTGLSYGKLLQTDRNTNQEGFEDVEDYGFFNASDFGLVGGVNYSIGNFMLGASWYQGIHDIAADQWIDEEGVVLDDPKAYIRSLTLSAAYRIGKPGQHIIEKIE